VQINLWDGDKKVAFHLHRYNHIEIEAEQVKKVFIGDKVIKPETVVCRKAKPLHIDY
jgi:hypothetical protein